MRHLTVGVLLGATITTTAFTLFRSRFGKHVTRWIFYTDARHTHPELYSWKALA